MIQENLKNKNDSSRPTNEIFSWESPVMIKFSVNDTEGGTAPGTENSHGILS